MTSLYVAVESTVRHYRRPSYPQPTLSELPSRVRLIIESVCERHGVHPRDFLNKQRRCRKTAPCQFEICHILRSMNYGVKGKRPSFPQIGRWIGRDHSTVIHACKRYAEIIALELAA